MTQQPTLWSAVPPPPDDAAWLMQVKVDAAHWWVRVNRQDAPLWIVPVEPTGSCAVSDSKWAVQMAKWRGQVGGVWTMPAAHLWLWLAIGIVPWHLVRRLDVARATWGSELDAVEARLRRALEGVTA